MPSINNISFSVQFDLTGVPTLRITDTSTNGLSRVASFDVTQPDLYTRVGNILSPDMGVGVTTFSLPLRLDSSGMPQCGTYTIVMTVRSTGYDDTTFTRTWVSQYKPVNLNIGEDFDVFTPNLSVRDNTSYSVSNYNYSSLTRAWSVSSTPTGTLTGSGVTQSFLYSGHYYAAVYSISLTSSLLYTHQVYSWFTVNETVNKSYSACIQAPPDYEGFVILISQLKSQLDAAINTCQKYDNLQADFEFAQSLFAHIIDKVRASDTANIYVDLQDLLEVLSNHQVPSCNPNNLPIPAFSLGLLNGVAWGTITGNIQNQTDLWNILQNLYVRDHFIHTQSVASTTWTVTHNMGKRPSVSIVDSSGDEVIGQVNHVSINQLTITFSAAFSGVAYLN